MDNAATSWPKPETVYRAADDFFRNKAGNPGRGSHSMALAAGDVIQETRELLAKFIPYGGCLNSQGNIPTDKLFTGQRPLLIYVPVSV